MKSILERDGSVLKFALSGDLTGGADAMQFATLLREAIATGGATELMLDVAGVGFVNSSGLGMLLAARQTAVDHGAKLVLLHPGEQLRGLLSITKLSDILGVA